MEDQLKFPCGEKQMSTRKKRNTPAKDWSSKSSLIWTTQCGLRTSVDSNAPFCDFRLNCGNLNFSQSSSSSRVYYFHHDRFLTTWYIDVWIFQLISRDTLRALYWAAKEYFRRAQLSHFCSVSKDHSRPNSFLWNILISAASHSWSSNLAYARLVITQM